MGSFTKVEALLAAASIGEVEPINTNESIASSN